MKRLTVIDMLKALRVELYKDTLYRIMDKIEPEIREELINYLIEVGE